MSHARNRDDWLDLIEREATVLVVDLVESVRLMLRDESAIIRRWLEFVRYAKDELVEQHEGQLIKSLGDGMMFTFPDPRQAVATARQLHAFLAAGNSQQPGEPALAVRAGVHCTKLFQNDLDIYGKGVNLAARLTALANPGETVLSVEARDRLVDRLDANLQDLGICFVKHIDEGVRVFREAGANRPTPVGAPPVHDALRPTIAVLPFEVFGAEDTQRSVGQWIGSAIITGLGRSRHLRVISHLSMSTLAGRPVDVSLLTITLRATYAISGRCVCTGNKLAIAWELTDLQNDEAIGGGALPAPVGDLFDADGVVISTIVQTAHAKILKRELAHTRSRPMASLEGFTLLLGGIQLLHRSADDDFARSFELLEYLAQLHPRAIEPRVWLAKGYALRAVQGKQVASSDRERALHLTRSALQEDPSNAFALATTGFVHCHLTRDYETARHCLESSVSENPNETFGHLYGAVIHGLEGRFGDAIAAFDCADATSPLDPARYLIDSIGAYAHLGAGSLNDAIRLAKRSLRANRLHAHSWRVLTIAQSEAGRLDEASHSLQELLRLQAELTERSYLATGKAGDSVRHRFAEALVRAGLPRG